MSRGMVVALVSSVALIRACAVWVTHVAAYQDARSDLYMLNVTREGRTVFSVECVGLPESVRTKNGDAMAYSSEPGERSLYVIGDGEYVNVEPVVQPPA
jgi:hypothetical protein